MLGLPQEPAQPQGQPGLGDFFSSEVGSADALGVYAEPEHCGSFHITDSGWDIKTVRLNKA